MLEESDRIDIVTEAKDGKLTLVIADAGLTPDPKERLEKLLSKLRTYVGFVIGPDFKKDYPEHNIKDVQILVMCKIPPSEEMKKIKQVTPHGEHEKAIDVLFQVFPGSAEPTAVIENKRNDGAIKPNENKDWGDLKQRLAWPEGATTSQTAGISIPRGTQDTSANELTSKRSNFVVHLAFIIALIFILLLRYYLYFVSPETRTGWTPKLIGSGLAALMMWAFTYGMCLKTKSKVLFGILSAITLFVGVIILPLWGWIWRHYHVSAFQENA